MSRGASEWRTPRSRARAIAPLVLFIGCTQKPSTTVVADKTPVTQTATRSAAPLVLTLTEVPKDDRYDGCGMSLDLPTDDEKKLTVFEANLLGDAHVGLNGKTYNLRCSDYGETKFDCAGDGVTARFSGEMFNLCGHETNEDCEIYGLRGTLEIRQQDTKVEFQLSGSGGC